jgi:hypothetical protein
LILALRLSEIEDNSGTDCLQLGIIWIFRVAGIARYCTIRRGPGGDQANGDQANEDQANVLQVAGMQKASI